MYLSLNSVIYDVDDLQRAKEWYGQVLNAEPVIDRPTFASFCIGNDRLGLNLACDAPSQGKGAGIAYWAVSDIRAEYRRLIELGAIAHGGIRDMGDGLLLATVEDPFGNLLGIGGIDPVPDNRAIEEKPSQTALWTTHMRAFSRFEASEEVRGPDDLAEIFLPEQDRASLRDPTLRGQVKKQKFVIGVYEYVIARTKIFDRFFLQALDGNIGQVVFLGAGYDSRPYRFQESARGVKMFELDIAPTQAHKKRCLTGAGVTPPPNLTYVSINFNTQSIGDALLPAGYDTQAKTLFVWEGVTYYLAPEAVDATLDFIRDHSPAGSIVVFDYIALWPGIFEAYGVKELIEFNATNQKGESGNNFTLEEGAVDAYLTEKGFQVTRHFNAEEIENGFLVMEDGTRFGRVTGSFRIAQATALGRKSNR